MEAGRGDMPLIRLKFPYANCGSDRTDFVVASRDNPQRDGGPILGESSVSGR